VIDPRRRRQRKPSLKKILKEVLSSGLDVTAVKVAPDGTATVKIGEANDPSENITPRRVTA
jgi:hypothetical protein